MVQLKWPKRLVIVRHGESGLNVALDESEESLDSILSKQKSTRDADIPLTELGVWQAEQTGEYLASTERFDKCFCSPYKRTLQTAEGIISRLGYDLRIYKDNRLREKEFGIFHGINPEEVRRRHPEEFDRRNRDGPYWHRPLGGENYVDVEQRLYCFLDKLVQNYHGKNVLVVTHQVPYKMFRALYEHLDEEEVLALEKTPNCGIQEYRIETTQRPEGLMKLVEYDKVAYDIARVADNPAIVN